MHVSEWRLDDSVNSAGDNRDIWPLTLYCSPASPIMDMMYGYEGREWPIVERVEIRYEIPEKGRASTDF